MGAWGVHAFENDDACDWAGELAESDDLTVIERAIDSALVDAGDYLEAPDATVALAACETIARLKGRFGQRNAYTEDVDKWVSSHPIAVPADLVSRADAAMTRILGENSELQELSQESDSFDEWRASVDELRSRLNR